jgi:hypothetical protein
MRTIEINGKIVTLEQRTIPARPIPAGRRKPKSDFRLLLEAMKPGESAFLSLSREEMKTKTPTLSNAGKATGHSYAYRTEGDGFRIYCTDKQALRRTIRPVQIVANGAAARW